MSSAKGNTMRSALGVARGRGSAKTGAADHWFAERIGGIALVPLALWFIFGAVIGNQGVDHATFQAWMGQPLNATLMILFILAAFHHGALGAIVVQEDYIHAPAVKHVTVLLTKLFAIAGALFGTVCVLTLAFGG
ncbi:succinate dehydrogenase, hydrophobic membrane anchor protein [Roseospira marina]|uniref:Succinate dehydrogenase hydrophobic membrane anchor subunit n=1 Tax=Roseospira marina TaxID=140057 RepID=A0A5M6ICN4_9PROT|nr:succinate dehydrogenase, hydrophobic membrane anchor protein [Roseospira marina]KAA5605963.1 succinate dehydrogenase, hydrophobic membrane anchor protein [Roseospira marina]MBB4313190.1 succinate dehydrogenase / fumarate reductase membrane anchor subunit [Roseospira marina]MBB5086069.1 succinate dehydrogenase / fumarate reductase membrane anchor subunit [Roseospira marina]